LSEKKQILKSASVITLVTLVSRFLGYVRDQRITLLLGTSLVADSFFLAFRIPNLLRRLVGEGAMTASFIPVFTGYMAEKPKEEVWDFANRLFWTLAIALAMITVLGIYFSPELVKLFTLLEPSPDRWDRAVHLNRVMFPYIFFIGLAALAMAILNCFHEFALPASTPIALNLCIIAGSFWAVQSNFSDPSLALAVSVLVGGFFQMVIQIPALLRKGMSFRFGFSLKHAGVRSVARLMVPGFFGVGIYQVNLVVSSIFAASPKMPDGTVTSIFVADRVIELVLGGYAVAVATAILPMMAHQAAAHDFESLKKTFGFSLRIVSYITIPAMVGLVILREPIIQVLFEHGKFGATSTALTARALLFGSIGLPAYAATKLIVPAFYSTKDTRTPVKVAFYAAAANILLNYIFLKSFFQTFQNGGPAFATSLSAYFNFLFLFVIFRKRFGRLGTLEILMSMGKVIMASVAMGALCLVLLRLTHFADLHGFFIRLGIFTFLLTAATASYIGITWVLRCPEVEEVWGIVSKSGARRGGDSLGLSE